MRAGSNEWVSRKESLRFERALRLIKFFVNNTSQKRLPVPCLAQRTTHTWEIIARPWKTVAAVGDEKIGLKFDLHETA